MLNLFTVKSQLHAPLCEFNLYKTEKQFNAINIETASVTPFEKFD